MTGATDDQGRPLDNEETVLRLALALWPVGPDDQPGDEGPQEVAKLMLTGIAGTEAIPQLVDRVAAGVIDTVRRSLAIADIIRRRSE